MNNDLAPFLVEQDDDYDFKVYCLAETTELALSIANSVFPKRMRLTVCELRRPSPYVTAANGSESDLIAALCKQTFRGYYQASYDANQHPLVIMRCPFVPFFTREEKINTLL